MVKKKPERLLWLYYVLFCKFLIHFHQLGKTDPDFPHINPHAFRHTVASTLISKGVDVVSAASYIGDVPTTVSTKYAHTITEAKIRAFEEMNAVIFG